MRFAEAGFNVVATARKMETLRDLAQLNEKYSGEIRAAQCDVTSEESRLTVVRFARETFGSIDILINNAGFGLFGPIELLALDSARHQLEVNVFGPMRLAQLVIPGMRTNGWGRIINVSSLAGRMYVPMGGWYSASKYAMEALTDALRLELSPFGIHTVSIMPGPVETGFVSNIQTPVRDAKDIPDVYRRIGNTLRARNDGHRHGTVSADRVAEVVFRAATTKKPKTRYPITTQDRMSLCMKKLFSDRAWDKLLVSFYKLGDAIQPRKENHTA